MPKSLNAGFQTVLDGFVKHLALCVSVTPNYGSAIGYTSAPFDFTYGGVDFKKDDGVTVTMIESAMGSEIERLSFSGVLGVDVTKAQLRAGMWAGASVEVFTLTFTAGSGIITANGKDTHASGYIGEVSIISDVEFSAEIRDVMQRAATNVNRETCQLCPWVLYSTQCGLSTTGHQSTVTVSSVSADGLTVHFTAVAGKSWKYGWIEALTGDNVGVLPVQIKDHSTSGGDDILTLYDRFPYTLAVGTSCQVSEGCDKSPTRCQALGRFASFGAHPNLPGEDKRNMTVLV